MKWFQDLVKAKGSIPSGFNSYQVQKILGSGSYGTVALCHKSNADQKVALKVVKNPDREGPLMSYLSKFGSASHHIVQWFCSFNFNGHVCHEYELLDISLGDFLEQSSALPLHHIRPILTQMAEGLKFLKSVNVIHGDLKPDNIMLVDRVRKPLQVKIVDFGLACPANLAEQGSFFGTLCYSAPEMAVGAPVHFALDMWSLGCMAAQLFLGQRLFNPTNSGKLIEVIVQMLGLPPRHVLDSGLHTRKYFCSPDGENWNLKSSCRSAKMRRPGPIEKLEDIFMRNPHDHGDLHLFVDLMKRLLDMDPDSRIDPQAMLDHPFINPSLRTRVDHLKPHLESQLPCSLSETSGQKRKRQDEEECLEKRLRGKDLVIVISSTESSNHPGCTSQRVSWGRKHHKPPGSSAPDHKPHLESQSPSFLSEISGQKRKREDEEVHLEKRLRGKDLVIVISSTESRDSQGKKYHTPPGPAPSPAQVVPGSSALHHKPHLESECIWSPSSLSKTLGALPTCGQKRKREDVEESAVIRKKRSK